MPNLIKTKFFRFLLERAVRSSSHPSLSDFVRDLLGHSLKKATGSGKHLKIEKFVSALLSNAKEGNAGNQFKAPM